ncbi:MAG: PQQ-binding-like beta-propeller repeat protein, partial [Mycobacterium sp.]
MTRRHLAVFLMVLGLVGGLVGAVATSGAATAGTIDWPAYLNGAQHSSYNPDAVAITPANAASLTPAWTFNPPGLGTLGNRFISSPTVYQGNIYIGSENGTFYDIDEATGGVVWSHFIGQQPKLTCAPLSFATTATVAPDPSTGAPTVYEAAPEGDLYAWDASTGNQLWRSVVGIPSTTQNDYFNWASATVANGMVYAGVSSNCDSPLVQGGLLAFDQSGGGLLARFQTNPTGDLGGSV